MAQVEADKKAAAAAECDAVPAVQCSRVDAGEQSSDEILFAAASAPDDHVRTVSFDMNVATREYSIPKGHRLWPYQMEPRSITPTSFVAQDPKALQSLSDSALAWSYHRARVLRRQLNQLSLIHI